MVSPSMFLTPEYGVAILLLTAMLLQVTKPGKRRPERRPIPVHHIHIWIGE